MPRRTLAPLTPILPVLSSNPSPRRTTTIVPKKYVLSFSRTSARMVSPANSASPTTLPGAPATRATAPGGNGAVTKKLCQNALATGVCVSKVCKEVHIKGTITSEETLKKSKNSQKKPAHNNSKLTHQQQQAGRDSQSRKPSTPSSRNSNPHADNSAPRSRADSASMDVPPSSGSNRQRSVSFSKSEKEQDKEDFLKHLSQMKSDFSRELSSMMQSSLQSLQLFHQQLAASQYHPSPQMFPQLQFQHRQYCPPTQQLPRLQM